MEGNAPETKSFWRDRAGTGQEWVASCRHDRRPLILILCSKVARLLSARRRRFVPMKATCGRRKRQQEVGITHLPREIETSLVKA